MEPAENGDRRRTIRRLITIGMGVFSFAAACGESSERADSAASSASGGSDTNDASSGGSEGDPDVDTSIGGIGAVSSVDVGTTPSVGSATSESSGGSAGAGGLGGNSSMSSSSSGGGSQMSSGGESSGGGSGGSTTATATNGQVMVCANGGGDSPLCLSQEEMETQARHGYGRDPLDPPRTDEEIAAAWDEQGCLPPNWVGSPCCNPGIVLTGRQGDRCCYITCEGELCCGMLTGTTGTVTTGGL